MLSFPHVLLISSYDVNCYFTNNLLFFLYLISGISLFSFLMKCGADPNAKDRMLVRSLKPSLHMNVDCTALFAAIVSRQVEVVQQLLQVPIMLFTPKST